MWSSLIINKFDKKLLKLYLKYCWKILVLFPTMLTIQIQFRLLFWTCGDLTQLSFKRVLFNNVTAIVLLYKELYLLKVYFKVHVCCFVREERCDSSCRQVVLDGDLPALDELVRWTPMIVQWRKQRDNGRWQWRRCVCATLAWHWVREVPRPT